MENVEKKILPSPYEFWGMDPFGELFTLGRRLEEALQALDDLPGDRDTLFFWLYACVRGAQTQIQPAWVRSCGRACGVEAMRIAEELGSGGRIYRRYAESLVGEAMPLPKREPREFARFTLLFADAYLKEVYPDWKNELCHKMDETLNAGYLKSMLDAVYLNNQPAPPLFMDFYTLLQNYLLPTTLWDEFFTGYREITLELLLRRVQLETSQKALDTFRRTWFTRPADVEPD
ncbi:hypothetical protein [Provencibacterium massiliense]|uniref:hypothetical protein n=1 Tax=Provencibacterium massiliense TaxID=1841868 RepID=UPI0009A8D8CF|nr:hypothetical protein [Provencibacterium massiliense]RGB65766.1 hypothetical protein DW086_10120 [Harryflintia acetispora]